MSVADAAGASPDWQETSDPASLPEKPLVSVIMLAYNHGTCLAQAIEGVRVQETPFPIELIIGEDCSKDDTRAVALDYQRRYPHLIRVLTSPHNVGASQNLRRLVLASRGDYFAICEGDDYWTAKDKLRRQIDLFEARPDVTICFHGAMALDHSSQELTPWPTNVAKSRDFSMAAVILGGGGLMPTASMVMRRSAMCPMDDWVLKCAAADYPIALWATSKGTCHGMADVMSVYRQGLPGSWSSRDMEIRAALRNTMSVITMLDEFPRKAQRSDVLPVVERMVRKTVLEIPRNFGTTPARSLPGWEKLEARLTLGERLLLIGYRYRLLRRVLNILEVKTRQLVLRLRR